MQKLELWRRVQSSCKRTRLVGACAWVQIKTGRSSAPWGGEGMFSDACGPEEVRDAGQELSWAGNGAGFPSP